MGSTAAVASIGSSVLSGTQQLLTGMGNARSYEMQGKFQKQQYEFNAKLVEEQAADSIVRGDKEAHLLKKQARRIIGSQKASLAAQGIEIDEGSALDIQADTAHAAELDAITIRNNAQREAYGYKMTALDYRTRGGFAEMDAQFKGSQSILSGGLGFASSFMKGGSTYLENFTGRGTATSGAYAPGSSTPGPWAPHS